MARINVNLENGTYSGTFFRKSDTNHTPKYDTLFTWKNVRLGSLPSVTDYIGAGFTYTNNYGEWYVGSHVDSNDFAGIKVSKTGKYFSLELPCHGHPTQWGSWPSMHAVTIEFYET